MILRLAKIFLILSLMGLAGIGGFIYGWSTGFDDGYTTVECPALIQADAANFLLRAAGYFLEFRVDPDGRLHLIVLNKIRPKNGGKKI